MVKPGTSRGTGVAKATAAAVAHRQRRGPRARDGDARGLERRHQHAPVLVAFEALAGCQHDVARVVVERDPDAAAAAFDADAGRVGQGEDGALRQAEVEAAGCRCVMADSFAFAMRMNIVSRRPLVTRSYGTRCMRIENAKRLAHRAPTCRRWSCCAASRPRPAR